MADGDKSKELYYGILDEIKDYNKGIVPNSGIIYNSMSIHEKYMMTMFNTTRASALITLAEGTEEYSIAFTSGDSVIDTILPNKIYKIEQDIDNSNYYRVGYNESTGKIEVYYRSCGDEEVSSIVTGDKIYVRCYVKPAFKISDTKDPVIGIEDEYFYELLKMAVLSKYSTKNRPFMALSDVYTMAKNYAVQNRNKVAYAVKSNPFNEMKW